MPAKYIYIVEQTQQVMVFNNKIHLLMNHERGMRDCGK